MFDVSEKLLGKAKKIRLVIFDVDGVLTDGKLFLSDDGQEYKAFHSQDGHGMKVLQDSGVNIAIITGRRSELVRIRMESLNVKHVYQGQADKREAYHELLGELWLSHDQVAYVGDDVVDLPVMSKVGLAVAVNNAHPMVKERSDWVTPNDGGCGAGRNICDLIMYSQGTLEKSLINLGALTE
jgi:3-deoxy-D-manno-octulosonate 8-phosphate phosphatase (KDO 8-P phosphatase)